MNGLELRATRRSSDRCSFRDLLRVGVAVVAVSCAAGAKGDVTFTHEVGTQGVPPWSVWLQPDPQDLFTTPITLGMDMGVLGNFLLVDNPAGLGLQPGDVINALHDDGTRGFGFGVVDLAFVIAVSPGAQGQPATPVNMRVPFNAADLYRVGTPGGHELLNTQQEMGLDGANFLEDINGIAFEPGAPFALGRRAYFSLRAGSPTLVNNGWSAADILTAIVGAPGTLQVAISASALGLAPADDLNGIVIYAAEDVDGDGRLDGPNDKRVVFFTVDPGSTGLPGTAVASQAAGNNAQNDIFRSEAFGSNRLLLDGVKDIRLAADDDVDALDTFQVFFGNDPLVSPGALPPPPPWDPEDGPPIYRFGISPDDPIGEIKVLVCTTDLPNKVNYSSRAQVCTPNGPVIITDSDTCLNVNGDPADPRTKANLIAQQLKALKHTNRDGVEKNIFVGVAVEPPPQNAANNIALQVRAVVSQDFMERSNALDQFNFSLSNWTASIIYCPPMILGAPGPAGGPFSLPTIEFDEIPKQDGFLRVSYWDAHPDDPTIEQLLVPFAAGQEPLTVLAQLRDLILDIGGDAALRQDGLTITRLPIEPDPELTGLNGPTVFEAGAPDFNVMVGTRIKGTDRRMIGTGCEGFCGSQSASNCWCDDSCAFFGDCCPDVCFACPDTEACGAAQCDPDEKQNLPLLPDLACATVPSNQIFLAEPQNGLPICGALCVTETGRILSSGYAFDVPEDGTSLALLTLETNVGAQLWLRTSDCPPETLQLASVPAGQSLTMESDALPPGTYIAEVRPAIDWVDPGIDPYYSGDLDGISCQSPALATNFRLGIDVVTEIDPCPGDLNGDSQVNVFDLLELLANWGACSDPSNCPADLDGNGIVNVFDLLELLSVWGPCP